MRRLLRLLTLWLIALALPVSGALAATAMGAHDGGRSPTMVMPDGSVMDAADMDDDAAGARCHGMDPAPAHAPDGAGCGFCCGPLAAQAGVLAVAPVAARARALRRLPADAADAAFLTGGTERPPRSPLA